MVSNKLTLRKNDSLLTPFPEGNQSTVRPGFKKLVSKSMLQSTIPEVLGWLLLPVAIPASGALMFMNITLGLVSAGVTVLGAGAGFFVNRRGNKTFDVLWEAEQGEEEHIKSLLLSNFGVNAGITPQIVYNCKLRDHSWEHNGESFSSKYDDETATYSFERKPIVEDADSLILSPTSTSKFQDLLVGKNHLISSDEALLLVRNIDYIFTALVLAPLSVELKHEVTRINADIFKLMRMCEEMAMYDDAEARQTLVKGLQVLEGDAQAIVAQAKSNLAQEIEAYQRYMETRSLSA